MSVKSGPGAVYKTSMRIISLSKLMLQLTVFEKFEKCPRVSQEKDGPHREMSR